jgi:hypothetical protein
MSTISCLDMPTEELQSNTDPGFGPAGPIVEQVDANPRDSDNGAKAGKSRMRTGKCICKNNPSGSACANCIGAAERVLQPSRTLEDLLDISEPHFLCRVRHWP